MEQQYSNLLYKIKKQINKIIFSYNVNSIKYKNQFIYRNQSIKGKNINFKNLFAVITNIIFKIIITLYHIFAHEILHSLFSSFIYVVIHIIKEIQSFSTLEYFKYILIHFLIFRISNMILKISYHIFFFRKLIIF